jgi:transposase
LTKCQQEETEKWVEQGADLEQDGVVRFRCIDLRDRIAKRFGVSLHVRSVGKLLRKLEFRRPSGQFWCQALLPRAIHIAV